MRIASAGIQQNAICLSRLQIDKYRAINKIQVKTPIHIGKGK